MRLAGLLFAAALAACGESDTDAVPESAVVPVPPFAAPHGRPGGKATYAAAVAFRETLSDT